MRYLTRSNFFDDAFESLFGSLNTSDKAVMKTDVIENEKSFTLEIDMAGFKKEDVTINFENGYLNVSAKSTASSEGKYITRERYSKVSRSYYVGEIDKNSIKAKLENGVLSIIIPKEEEKLPESTNVLID